MSTKVTQSMTVTETSSTMPEKFAFNFPVLKTKDGALKFFELVIGIACLSIVFSGHLSNIPPDASVSVALLTISVLSTSLLTSLLLLSHLMSPMAESVLPKSIFELVSNVAAFLFLIMSGMAFLIIIAEEHHEYPEHDYSIALAVLGVVNGILYFFSSYFSFKTFRST